MGFKLAKDIDKVEIPFEFNNNFIIINVIFDNVFPLKFIFDTGSENTILVKKEFAEILNISYERTFQVMGADLQRPLTAHLARGVNIDLPNLLGDNLDLLILQDDYFKFEQYTGNRIHGILGMDLFKTFTIQIDYQEEKLILHRIEDFKLPAKFNKIPIEVHRNKPYIHAAGEIGQDTTAALKLLVDTGASLSLMLYNDSTRAFQIPEKIVPGKIGNGLGGFINGYVGRIAKLTFSDYHFNGVITNFQILDSTLTRVYDDRDGLIGNEILSRFKVIFDLSKGSLFLKPIKKYNSYFKFDKSGITLIASGKTLNRFMVKELIPDSPAARAGIKIGDVVKSINFMPANFYDLRSLTDILQKRTGKRIRLVVEREGLRKIIKFRLEDLI